MNGKMRLLMAIVAVYPLSLPAQGIDDVISSLDKAGCYEATVDYTVLMSLQDDVNYTINLQSDAAPDDTLAPCSYLIKWSIDTPMGPSTGFSAYFDKNVYNYRGDRLLEYHFDWDSIPFQPRGRGAAMLPGVQRSAQFASLLPQFIGEELRGYIDNPDYCITFHPDTVVDDRRCKAVDGKMSVDGNVYREFLYAFDYETGLPAYIQFENNPGALAEQTIEARYSYPSLPEPCIELSEDVLRDLYPEIFEKYRESNFAIANLPGQRLPGFSLPTVTGERYSRNKSDSFRCPTMVVLIDPNSTFAGATVDAIRSAADRLPFDTDVIWAFVDNRVDDIEAVMPRPRQGEHMLMSAKSLARDCGASSYPVVIIVRADGTVADVVLGYNNDLASVVIQKAAVAVNR